MTHLKKLMLEELERRNYAPSTIRAYLRAVDEYACTSTRHVCRHPLPRGSLVVQNPLAHTDSDAYVESVLVSASFPHLHGHSKPIARPFQNGFLQVAVSKTLRPPAFRAPDVYLPERFRYSTRTFRPLTHASAVVISELKPGVLSLALPG